MQNRVRVLTHVPYWVVLALRLQVGVVYVFAGVAKLNRDWLIEAQPLRMWLSANSDVAWIGPWLSESWVAHGAALAGVGFDLSVVFLLSWAKTRALAFVLLLGFHVATAWLFPIGMFPWLMTALATVFFPPDWPRVLAARVGVRVATEEVSHGVWRGWWASRVLIAAHCAMQCVITFA